MKNKTWEKNSQINISEIKDTPQHIFWLDKFNVSRWNGRYISCCCHEIPNDDPNKNLWKSKIFTSRVYCKGNIFIVCVCVCVHLLVCLCMCLFRLNFWSGWHRNFLVWWYILTISRSSLTTKVIGSRSMSHNGKC